MSASMNAAIQMGPNYTENLEIFKNTNFEELQNLFDITQKLVTYKQLEILIVKTVECTSPSWTRSTCAFSRSSDQVDEGKSTSLFRFRLVLGEMSILQKQIEDAKVKSKSGCEVMTVKSKGHG